MAPEKQTGFLSSLQDDYQQANLSHADRTMLEYACKLTGDPAGITAVDISWLRECGFTDRAIHDMCAITAYFAFVNRIADGLGVELEEG